MFNRGVKTTPKTESNYQEEWKISVIEVLELDPWKYFQKSAYSYSKVRI
ncbi:hypothetical protein [Cyanothece sp. BG0011]|nr:hypothetical protein [Cyanothece sp. BG0011]